MKKDNFFPDDSNSHPGCCVGRKVQKGFYAGAQGAAQLSVMFNEADAEKPEDHRSKCGTSFGVTGGYNFNKHGTLAPAK